MISQEINRLKLAKTDIKQVLEDKGVEVPSSTKLDGYAELIEDVGSNGAFGTISPDLYDSSIFSTTLDATFLKKSITSVDIPDGVTTVSGYTFSSGPSLKYLHIPSSVTAFGNSCFEGCTNLRQIIWDTPTGAVTCGNNIFHKCGITSIVIPEGITSLPSGMLNGCSKLENVGIPQSCTSIGSYCFYATPLLKSITIPKNVLSIGNRAFEDSNIEDVVFEEGSLLQTIYTNAFNSNKLNTITFTCITPPVLENQTTINNHVSTIYVPVESVEAYKTATNWSNLANKIQPIPTA